MHSAVKTGGYLDRNSTFPHILILLLTIKAREIKDWTSDVEEKMAKTTIPALQRKAELMNWRQKNTNQKRSQKLLNLQQKP